MGLLDELDKSRPVFELIKNDESYDKKKTVLRGDELFLLCQERYNKLQTILRPLEKRLGENIEITEISFAQIAEEESPRIVVRYQKDDLQSFFSISNLGLKDIEISSRDNKLESWGFVLINKGMILEIFNKINKESLDDEISINSTSKRFTIVDTMKNFSIKDITGKVLSIDGSHTLYAKEGIMYNKEKIVTTNPKLREVLLDDNNIMNIYQHIRVYEEDIPKILIKKTNQ